MSFFALTRGDQPSPTYLLCAVVLAVSTTAGCGDSCVAVGTLVETPSGARRIEELRVGDQVISIDVNTGNRSVGIVSQIRRGYGWCRRLETENSSLWLTGEHPIYSPEAGEFRQAREWFSGQLRDTRTANGQTWRVTSAAWFERRPCRVIDLTLTNEPLTFVANGTVLHNKSVVFFCDSDEECSEGSYCARYDCIRCDCRCDSNEACVRINSECDACRPFGTSPIGSLGHQCLSDAECTSGERCVVGIKFDNVCLAARSE